MRVGDLMWDRGWYGDICKRRGLRCRTEDGVRDVYERRGLRCGTEDGVRDICEIRGLRCGTEDGMLTFLKDGDLDVGQRMVC